MPRWLCQLTMLLTIASAGIARAGDTVVIYKDNRVVATSADESRFDVHDSEKIRKMATMYSEMYGVDTNLVLAVIKTESDYDRYAKSHAGAEGVMQLMPGAARFLGVDNSFGLNANIEAGVKYLRMLLDRFPQTEVALAAYNAGPESVRKHGGIPPYSETRKYVRKVLAEYARLKSEKSD